MASFSEPEFLSVEEILRVRIVSVLEAQKRP